MNETQIFPLGEDAVTVEFGVEISEQLNLKALRLAAFFEQNKFPGFIETVPAYASTTIFFNVVTVRKNFSRFPNAFQAVRSLVVKALQNLAEIPEAEPRLVEIPVSFAETDAPDLQFVAETNNLQPHEAIEIFTAKTYRVFMLGFLPGFPYMGEIDERIAAPRHKTPRLKVPKGSVGIAGRQTGIYPFESPGGWQIIGKTEIELFTPEQETPVFFQPGNLVRFISV